MTSKKIRAVAESTEIRNAFAAGSFALSDRNDNNDYWVDFMHSLMADNEAIKNAKGELLEKMLYSQAVTLDAVFTKLIVKSSGSVNANNHDVAEKYLNLALKSQNQARQALIALADIKNPKVTTINKQTNLANQQIVANSIQNQDSGNELMDDTCNENKQRLGVDGGAQKEAIEINSEVEALEKIDGR